MKATINNRTYTMTAQPELQNLKAHLLSRGFDGVMYQGISLPEGRQRKTFQGLFYRSAKTGEFVSAI